MATKPSVNGLNTGSSLVAKIPEGVMPNSQDELVSLVLEKDKLIVKLQLELSKANAEIERLKGTQPPLQMPVEANQKELTTRERQQLEKLRKEIIEVKQQRAELTKTAEELKKQVQELQARLPV